jgi:TonB family protein
MEAVVRPGEPVLREPRFLLDLQAGGENRPRSAVASVLLHAAAIGCLVLLPQSVTQTPHFLARLQNQTPLIAPPTELTQRAPNRGTVGKEFDLENLLPRPRVQVPPSAAPSTMRPAASVPAPVPAKAAPLVAPEPPKVEVAQQTPPLPLGVLNAPQPPPQIQVQEKPKLAFETPGGPPQPRTNPGRIPVPTGRVDEAVRSVMRGRGGGVTVGDIGEGMGGLGEGINLPPSPGRAQSSLELLSDSGGVDFRPYLIRVLAAVRRNWFAVIPESARLGQAAGRVVVQFAVDRSGKLIKVAFASESGIRALDLAAVSGISASNPLPPVPPEFKGEQLRLQLTFLYNVRR